MLNVLPPFQINKECVLYDLDSLHVDIIHQNKHY